MNANAPRIPLQGLRNAMEHRARPRTALRLRAMLWRRGDYLGAARTADLSREGALIETPAVELAPGEVVTVRLYPPSGRRLPALRALVRHCARGRAGIFFEDLLPTTLFANPPATFDSF